MAISLRRPQFHTASLIAVLLLLAALTVQLIMTLFEHKSDRADLAELNNVKYGLLNADVWVDQLTAIMEKKIGEFEMTPDNRAAIKLSLERMLDTLLTEGDRYMRRENQRGRWWKRTTGKLKQSVQDIFIDMDTVREAVPEYADAILDEMEKPEARAELNEFLRDLLRDVGTATFAKVDFSKIEDIRTRYHCEARMTCQRTIAQELEAGHAAAIRQALILLTLTAILFLLVWNRRESIDPRRLDVLAFACALLMACGVLTPMIEVEARISELRFYLLGEPMIFTDQVLYFQSKSVLDVVQVLVATGAVDMILVGLLIMTFSVVFPLGKLAASLIYLRDWHGLRCAPLVQFFALKSGKWSMADVMVVAIFMAFIGFNGLIGSQLSNFADAGGDTVDVLTTNGTALQIGFFMFLAFCLASLVTSSWIESATLKPRRGTHPDRTGPLTTTPAGQPVVGEPQSSTRHPPESA